MLDGVHHKGSVPYGAFVKFNFDSKVFMLIVFCIFENKIITL